MINLVKFIQIDPETILATIEFHGDECQIYYSIDKNGLVVLEEIGSSKNSELRSDLEEAVAIGEDDDNKQITEYLALRDHIPAEIQEKL